MANQIVTVNVSQQVASAPSMLQGTGALISLGGTTLTTGAYQLLTQLSDLTPILAPTGQAEILAMATTFFGQGSTVPVYVLELGANGLPSALGTFITANPGFIYAYLAPKEWDALPQEVASATITAGGSGYTTAPTVTFSAPTSGTTATGTATISNGAVTGITITNPGSGYTGTATITFSGGGGTGAAATAVMIGEFPAFVTSYEGLTAQTYFFATTTNSTYSQYTSTMKDVFWLVESPNAPTTEFSCAAPFWSFLANSPSAVSRMLPMAFRYMYSVTAYPSVGNAATLAAIKAANGNYIGTGAEGGISNTVLFWGTMADGNDASYWYDVDWVVINSHLRLAAAVINGSNNPQNPLYYNQNGINRLLAEEQSLANSALAFGVALQATVTATPFATYVQQNPTNYAAGIYNGIAMTFVPQLGFKSITFNVTVSNIPTSA